MSMQYRIQLPITREKRGWSQQYITIYPPEEQISACKEWCRLMVGTNGWNYYGKYKKVPCEFRFKRGEDLVAFKLVFGLHD
jgi:hypothetical protein